MKGAEHSISSNDSQSSHMAAREEEEGVRVGKGLSSACPFVEERKNVEGRSAAPSLAAGGASAKMQDQHRCALAVSAVEFEPGEREKKVGWLQSIQYPHLSYLSGWLPGCRVISRSHQRTMLCALADNGLFFDLVALRLAVRDQAR